MVFSCEMKEHLQRWSNHSQVGRHTEMTTKSRGNSYRCSVHRSQINHPEQKQFARTSSTPDKSSPALTSGFCLWWKLHDKYSVLDSFRGYLSTLTLTRLIETWRPGGHARVLKISDLLLNHLLNGWSSSEGKYRPLVTEMHQKAQNVIDSFCTWWNINIPTHGKHIPLKQTLLNLCILLFPSLCFSDYCNMDPNIFSHRGKHKQINWR